jgi:hypothetical protein
VARAGPSVLVRQRPVIGDNGSSHLACRLPETSQDQRILVHPQRTHRCLGQRMGARDAVCDTSDVHESLSKSKLVPAQVHAFRDTPSIARGQEHHRVVSFPVVSEAARGCAPLLDLGWRAMRTGTDIGMGVAFGQRSASARVSPS